MFPPFSPYTLSFRNDTYYTVTWNHPQACPEDLDDNSLSPTTKYIIFVLAAVDGALFGISLLLLFRFIRLKTARDPVPPNPYPIHDLFEQAQSTFNIPTDTQLHLFVSSKIPSVASVYDCSLNATHLDEPDIATQLTTLEPPPYELPQTPRPYNQTGANQIEMVEYHRH